MDRGFVLSLEAVVSAMLFGSALMLLFQPASVSLGDIVVLQQENDLLKVWGVRYPSNAEALADAEKMFGKNFDLVIDGEIVRDCGMNGEGIASEGVLLDDFLAEHRVLIRVYAG